MSRMLPDLASRFSALERRRVTLMERLADCSESALVFKPSGDAWCLLEVIDHVSRSEAASLDYVRKKLPHVNASLRPGLRSRWAFLMLRLVLVLPLRFKMPPSVKNSLGPGEDLTLEEVKTRWISNHSQWRELLDGFPAELLEAPLFRHPISGQMNLESALQFLAAHFDHHLRQVERLIAHPDFPAGSGVRTRG